MTPGVGPLSRGARMIPGVGPVSRGARMIPGVGPVSRGAGATCGPGALRGRGWNSIRRPRGAHSGRRFAEFPQSALTRSPEVADNCLSDSQRQQLNALMSQIDQPHSTFLPARLFSGRKSTVSLSPPSRWVVDNVERQAQKTLSQND